jgi:hypothetical protein
MGKKNKGGLDGTRLLLGGYDREMERFGVKGMQMGGKAQQMTGNDYRSEKDVEKDMIDSARNDYDLRRTLEAAAMSGKGKAQKILDKGFKNAGDITNALNFSEKAAKRHGQGGDFSSASDYMGLTQSMVERDRRKFNEDIDSRIAAATPEEQADQATSAIPEKVSVSPEMQAAKDKVKAWESGSAGTVNPYGGDSSSSVYGAADDAQDQAAIVPDSTDSSQAAAQSYLSQHKEKMKREKNFQPTI